MKPFFRLCGLLLILGCLPSAHGQTSLQVSKIEIKHVGPHAVSDDLIHSNIRVKVGDPYLRTAVDDDVRNLYRTGQFYNIRVTDDITGGGVVLTYIVQGKPRLLEIKFTGNKKYPDAKLRKKLTSKIGEPLDEHKLFTDCQELQKMYQKAGYPGTKVTYVPSIDETTGRGSATIAITESPKIKITDIQFIGAQTFPEKQLRKVCKTRRHWMFSWLTGSGAFKEDEFDDDKEKLAAFYREKGYIDFEIKDVEFVRPTPKTMIIRFNVFEGSQYKVGAIKFSGNKLFSVADIAAGNRAAHPGNPLKKIKLGPNGMEMDLGDVFTPDGLNKDTDAIKDFYGSKGYIDVSPGRNLQVKKIPNTESGTMDLEFLIEEGSKSYIEKIEIRGNVKTKDRVIRRELSVSPGDVFDMVRVNTSKQRIEGLDYFGKVDARPEPTDVPNRKNLVVGVDEKNTGNMTLGAGFSSVDSLVGFAEVYQGNFDLFHPPTFTGAGQKFRLRVQLGTRRKDLETEFIEPWFMERKLNLNVNLFYRELDYLSPNNLYRETLIGGRVGLKRALGSDFFIGGVGYTLQQVGIKFNGNVVAPPAIPPGLQQADPPPGEVWAPNTMLAEKGNTMISKFDASITWDTRGPGFLPNKGQQTTLTAELAGPFGGAKDFYRLELKSHWYFKGLASGHVLEVLGGTGIADAYGSTGQVPFYQRWYLGGLNSLRGYEFDNISTRSPEDNYKEPVGGNTYWFGSIEYSLPIIERLRFAVFYDIGNVMDRSYSYDFSNYNDNWGIGLRLNLPLGGASGTPLRLDYGIPIRHDKFNGGSGRFQFSVGFDRPF